MSYIGTKPQIATTLADNIVTADKIASGAVTDPKIAAMAASKLSGVIPDANAPIGSVIQVVNSTLSSSTTTSSSSYQSTGLSASIIPRATTSQIMVVAYASVLANNSNNTGFHEALGLVGLFRNGSLIEELQVGWTLSGVSGFKDWQGAVTFSLVDSPSTTSSCTYDLRIRSGSSSFAMTFRNTAQYPSGGTNSNPRLTLMEIAA